MPVAPKASAAPEVPLASSRPRRVGEMMRTRFIALSPSDSLQEAGQLMRFARVRRLPVVEDGRLVGSVSQRDVLVRSLESALAAGGEETRRALRLLSVGGLVSEAIPTLPADASLRQAVESLVAEGEGFVAVVDDADEPPRLLGLVTESDLLDLALRRVP